MFKKIYSLGKTLSKAEQKSIVGGFIRLPSEEFICSCNGHELGTASSSSGCAAQCYACVSNGGCEPF